MRIQVKDKSNNGAVFIRNLTPQKKVERQLNDIITELKEARDNLSTLKSQMEKAIYEQN